MCFCRKCVSVGRPGSGRLFVGPPPRPAGSLPPAPCSFPYGTGLPPRAGNRTRRIHHRRPARRHLRDRRAGPRGVGGRSPPHEPGRGRSRPGRGQAGGVDSAGSTRKRFIPQGIRRARAACGIGPGRRRTAAERSSGDGERRVPPHGFPSVPFAQDRIPGEVENQGGRSLGCPGCHNLLQPMIPTEFTVNLPDQNEPGRPIAARADLSRGRLRGENPQPQCREQCRSITVRAGTQTFRSTLRHSPGTQTRS